MLYAFAVDLEKFPNPLKTDKALNQGIYLTFKPLRAGIIPAH
jgi:hypothetical protein